MQHENLYFSWVIPELTAILDQKAGEENRDYSEGTATNAFCKHFLRPLILHYRFLPFAV